MRQQVLRQKQQNPPEEEQLKSKRILDLEPPSLIKFAYELIEKDLKKRTMEEGNTKKISSLEVGRLIVSFLNKKQKPFSNRQFYKYFYEQHDKAEKLEILEKVCLKIQEVLRDRNLLKEDLEDGTRIK